MSSVDGTDEMGETSRRRALLEAPVGVRVERFAELWRCVDDEDSPEEVVANCREEMWVVGATIAVDVIGAVMRIADALDTLAARAHARGEAGGTLTPTANAMPTPTAGGA